MKNLKNNKLLRLAQFCFCLFLLINLNSCSEEDDSVQQNVETQAILPENLMWEACSQYTIVPEFDNVILPAKNYTWSAQPDGLVDFTVQPASFAITVQTISEGTVTLTLESDDGEISSSVDIIIEGGDDNVLKILAIGNSFSEDALEAHFWGIANAAGKEVIVGNMYVGGADLDTHAANATSDSNSYSYRKIELDGTRNVTSNFSISDAMADENWDFISFQQASYDSGLYDTFVTPLPIVYDVVQGLNSAECTTTSYILHKTWAYAQNSTHPGFPNYNNDQMTMFNGIIDAYNQAENLIPADMVVPAGTAIQNGRTSFLGDGFTRDGFHLNDLGQYTASCTWFEILFGESAIGNTYQPEGILPFYVELAQQAAHEAVLNPDEITVLTDFQNAPGGNGVFTEPVFINFSSTDNPEGWNAYSSFLEGSGIPDITYPDGEFSGVAASTTARFRGINNTAGVPATTTDFNMPDGVSTSFFYSHAQQWGNNDPIEESVIEFSGFTSDDSYELCFYGSRNNVGDNRDTRYTVSGSTEQTVTLDASNNETNIVCISNVQADADGKITLTVSAGDSNDNGNQFYYLNAMRIAPL